MAFITMVLSVLLIKVVGFFLKLLPAADFSQIDGFLSVTTHVANIFAWAQTFLPVALIVFLFSLTMAAYFCKFIYKLAFTIVSFFK